VPLDHFVEQRKHLIPDAAAVRNIFQTRIIQPLPQFVQLPRAVGHHCQQHQQHERQGKRGREYNPQQQRDHRAI
jgi:hypothetical protein